METTIRIMLVDDHEIVRQGLAAVLGVVENFQIIGQAGGQHEAVDMALRCAPDIILMDIQLPHVDGWTIISALRKNHQTENIPIVALTAHAMTGDREKALSLGCNSYISKPIDTRNFVSEIEKVYSASKQ